VTDGRPPRRWARWGPIAAVLLALAGGLLVWELGDDHGDAGRDLPPVEITSDAPHRATLAELAAASDLVVRAEVVATDRGRLFGDAGANAIESRVVTLSVTRVLRGAAAPGSGTVLVEEEGWTADGAPLIVDGLGPSEVSDDAVWFLTRVGSEEELRYVVVSAEGRYRVDGDRLRGAAGDDPLVAELAALGPAALEAAVLAAP
jgi:hypothetical protein